MRKKLLLLCTLALVSIFALAGCNQDNAETETTSDTSNMITQAIANVENVNSVSYDITTDMAMEFTLDEEGTSTTMKTTSTSISTAQFINDPLSVSMNTSMTTTTDMGTNEVIETTSYGEIVDGNLVLYTNTQDTWFKQTIGTAEEIEQYNPAQAMQIYLESAGDFKEDGTEAVNGSEATKFTGTISSDDFQAVFDNIAGMGSQFESIGLNQQTLAKSISDAGDLPVSIWIDNATVMPVKYEMDMTTFIQALISEVSNTIEGLGEVSYDISNVFVSNTVTGYDNVESIEIPQEARDAQELSDVVAGLETEAAQ